MLKNKIRVGKRVFNIPLISKDLFVIRDTKDGFDKNSMCIIISGLEDLSLPKQKAILELLVADLPDLKTALERHNKKFAKYQKVKKKK